MKKNKLVFNEEVERLLEEFETYVKMDLGMKD